MKIAIITDQHFGARKSSRIFHEYFKDFYDNVFFPTLEKENIKVLFDLGDTIDNRKAVDIWSVNWSRKYYFDRLQEMGIEVHSLVGNHTAYYKNTNDLNTLYMLLSEYDNVNCYQDALDLDIEGTSILFVPWICPDKYDKSLQTIHRSTSKVAVRHL